MGLCTVVVLVSTRMVQMVLSTSSILELDTLNHCFKILFQERMKPYGKFQNDSRGRWRLSA
nr:MAG TPA: hypothetical protein [Bacteriophage sp.]